MQVDGYPDHQVTPTSCIVQVLPVNSRGITSERPRAGCLILTKFEMQISKNCKRERIVKK